MTAAQSIVLAIVVPLVVLAILYAIFRTSGLLMRRPRVFGTVLMVLGLLNPAVAVWEGDRSAFGMALSVFVGASMFIFGLLWALRGTPTPVD